MKKILSILVLIVLLFTLSSCTVKKTKTTKEEKYDNYLSKVEYAENYMPNADACGNYSSLTATYKHEFLLFFEVHTVGLFLSYNENEYASQKNHIITNYEFFTPDDVSLESDCDATVGNYNIRLVNYEYKYSTTQMGLLIGMDDTNHKICYLFYYDFDLDVMDNLDAYIKDYFYLQ